MRVESKKKIKDAPVTVVKLMLESWRLLLASRFERGEKQRDNLYTRRQLSLKKDEGQRPRGDAKGKETS